MSLNDLSHNNKLPIWGTFILVLTLMGCLKDTEEFIPLEDNVQANAFGVVLDEQNLPVNTTIVEMEGETAITDSNGVFIFSNVVVPADHATIAFTAPGYFKTFKSFIPDKESIPSFTIKLKSLGESYKTNSGSSSNLTTDENIVLEPTADSWLQNGGSYNGEVILNTAYLNPLDENVFSQIAGEPLAKNDEDEEGMLIHYGSIYLQMRDITNGEVTVDEQVGMKLRMPVPDDLTAAAPTSAPFWKLNVSTNEWEMAGEAFLINGFYEATVYESGVYSVQEFKEFVRITGKVLDLDNTPLENVLISLSSKNIPIKRRIWSNANGTFNTYAPLRESMIVGLENECFETIEQFATSELLSTTELKDIKIDPGTKYRKIQGQLLECAGTTNGVRDGYTFIKTDQNQWIIPVQQGFFSLSLFICPDRFSVSGVDLNHQLSASPTTITELSSKPEVINVGVLKACE